MDDKMIESVLIKQGEMQSDLKNIKDEIVSLRQSRHEHSNEIHRQNGDISGLKKDIHAINQNVAGMKDSLEKYMESMKENVDSVRKNVVEIFKWKWTIFGVLVTVILISGDLGSTLLQFIKATK